MPLQIDLRDAHKVLPAGDDTALLLGIGAGQLGPFLLLQKRLIDLGAMLRQAIGGRRVGGQTIRLTQRVDRFFENPGLGACAGRGLLGNLCEGPGLGVWMFLHTFQQIGKLRR